MTTTTGEYRRLRGKGWHAQEAYRTAKVKRQWYEMGGHVAEERDHTEEDDRKVRLRYVPDDYAEMDNLKGDCFDPKHNRHISEKKLAEQEKEFEEVVYREGVYGIVSEFWDG
jgi:hypothetical protein